MSEQDGTHFLDENGHEVMDPTPMEPPVGYVQTPSMVDIIREQIRNSLVLAGEDAEMETFEEADDFDVGDDYDPTSPYEEQFEPPASQAEPPSAAETNPLTTFPPLS